jgi:hypothetical protein
MSAGAAARDCAAARGAGGGSYERGTLEFPYGGSGRERESEHGTSHGGGGGAGGGAGAGRTRPALEHPLEQLWLRLRLLPCVAAAVI